MEGIKFYGSTTVGERGQVGLPTRLRQELDIKVGEKLAVMAINRMAISGIVMVKSKDLTTIIEKIFGEDFGKLIEEKKTE